jgi:pyrimidine deaminase RibD-like protein
MEDHDQRPMHEAICLARQCSPSKESIPRVGAVFASLGKILVRGKRGTGDHNDDQHAEHNAIATAREQLTSLAGTSLYTTLEPCTKDVRSKPLECCTEQILRANVKKVFIGILDPNQGVRGKGLWELQSHGIEIELFPPDLAREILEMNGHFIRVHQTIGAQITEPVPLQTFGLTQQEDGSWFGQCRIVCKCNSPPDESIKIIVQRGGEWWPARNYLRRINEKEWAAEVYFGCEGDHIIHIVRATDTGAILLSYYQDVVQRNLDQRDRLNRWREDAGLSTDLPNAILGSYQEIRMGHLPKGLESQAQVQVRVVKEDRAITADEIVPELTEGSLLALKALSEEFGCHIVMNPRIPTKEDGWIRFDGAFRRGEDLVGIDIYELGTAGTGIRYFQTEYLVGLVPKLAFDRFRKCILCCVVVSDAAAERDEDARKRLEEILRTLPGSTVKTYRLNELRDRYKPS